MQSDTGESQTTNTVDSSSKSIALSINVNKVALIRNSREGDNPNLVDHAAHCLDLGCQGITVHPRPDQRHIRPEDCQALAQLVAQRKSANAGIELNIEGNPFAAPTAAKRRDFSDYPGFLAIVESAQPDQATLVPDTDAQLTSDHGFDLRGDNAALEQHIAHCKASGARVSLFMDPDIDQISRAREVGADCIELYTGPFAEAFASGEQAEAKRIFEQHCAAAEHALSCGLAVNAGHDLNYHNLRMYRDLPGLEEVSIGHAFIVDSIELGLETCMEYYLAALQPQS